MSCFSLQTDRHRRSLGFRYGTAFLTVIAAVGILNSSLLSATVAGAEDIIMVRNSSHTLEDFREYARLATRLKPYGRVLIEISALADKSWYEIPEGGSPWHEYACYISTPWKFFPHPEIAPHIPKESVAANRELLLGKAKVVRNLGLEPFMYCKSTHFLPESFFLEHPELRGPRVDHPRRSKREEFSWCTDLPRTREMIEWMIGEIKRNVPDLAAIVTGANDSGAGLCWAAAQYPGPNGPQHCRSISTAQRVRTLCETIHQGARQGGGEIVLRWGNVNFWDHEMETVLPMLPPNTFINDKDASLTITGTQINRMFPFRGMVDPLAVIKAMEHFQDERVGSILLRFSDQYYGRADDSAEAVSRFLDLFETCVAKPMNGLHRRLDRLREISESWGGKNNRDAVFEAFYNMNQGLSLLQLAAPLYYRHPLFLRVSLRYMNRPLVIKPELLRPEEEAYFLPYVFNVRQGEARADYIDIHGGRPLGPRTRHDEGLQRSLRLLRRAADVLENLENAPQGEWLRKVALGLKMYVSFIRSINNFYFAQLIRDRNSEALAGEPKIPPKVATSTGDRDFLPWNEIMRDEFDNTNKLIRLLRDGGLELVVRATEPRHEDTFLLGPDFAEQLLRKVKIMREHWLDVQDYLTPPHK